MIKTITYNNATLSYKTCGKGFPVVLLHGFAETHTVWHNQLTFLKKYYRLIVPDLPGSGASGLYQPAKKNLSIAALAQAVHSIIIHEQVKHCIMIGHSMGGYITLSYAEKYAHTLKAFGLVHSTAFADNKEKKQNRKRGIKAMEAYGSYAFIKATTPGLFTAAFKQKHAEVVEKLVKNGRHFKKENLQQYYYAMLNRADKLQVLKNAALPVLFVAGIDDTIIPLSDVLKQVHEPEIAYIHIIKHVAHQSLLEVPGDLNKILKHFIDEAA